MGRYHSHPSHPYRHPVRTKHMTKAGRSRKRRKLPARNVLGMFKKGR